MTLLYQFRIQNSTHHNQKEVGFVGYFYPLLNIYYSHCFKVLKFGMGETRSRIAHKSMIVNFRYFEKAATKV